MLFENKRSQDKNVVKGNLFVCEMQLLQNRQKVAKEFLRRVLFVNSYEPVETFTMQAAYFLYCTVNYFFTKNVSLIFDRFNVQ